MTAATATLCALAAALLFSTGGVAIKGSELLPLQISATRAALAAAMLFAFLPETRKAPKPGGPRLMPWVTALAYAGTVTLYVVANRFTTAANTIFLQSTATLWVMVFSRIILGEAVSRRDLIGGAVILGGLVLCFFDAREPNALASDPLLGNSLALGSGLCFGLTLIGMRHASRGGAGGSSNRAVLRGNVIAALLGAALLSSQGLDQWSVGTTQDWIGILWLGTCQVGLAYILLGKAMGSLSATRAVLLLMLEPVCNPVWTWWLVGEVPSPPAIAGGTLILGAVTWLGLGDRRADRNAAVVETRGTTS